MAAAMVLTLALGASQSLAQNNNRGDRGDRGGPGGGPGGPGGGGGRNFDPAQFRERMMERTKEMLEVTDDTEWKAIEPRVQKVMDTRMSTMSGMGRGMMFGRRGGERGGDNGGDRNRGPFGGQPNPAMDALDRAIEGKASKEDLKAAIAKVVESRKAKQAELDKAQDDLRKVLSVRQEALATQMGLL
jgi:hypothetical protein